MKKRSDNRYCIRVNIGTDEKGKSKYKPVYGKTQKEVKEKANKLLTSLGMGLSSDEIDSSLGKWITMFLNAEKQRLTKQEYKTKKYRIEYFESSLNKSRKISEIKPFEVEEFLYQLADKNPKTGTKSSKKTISEYKQVIGQMFKFAQINGAIVTNPCDLVREVQGVKKKERQALTSEQQMQILALPDDMLPDKTMALLGMLAGLRRGEITALEWDDIDFKNHLIRINKSYNYRNNITKDPKTETSLRYVPMNDILATHLSKVKRESKYVCGHLLKQYEWENAKNRVLLHIESTLKEHSKTYSLGQRCTQLISFKPFTWHELRHTYATTLYDANIPVKAAQKFLGHAQTSTTMDIYTHLSANKELEAIRLIQQYGSQMVVSQNDNR